MLLVLGPACKHAESDNFCDFSTWLSRGWCNVEVFCSTVAPFEQDQVLIRGPNNVEFINRMDSMHLSPGLGMEIRPPDIYEIQLHSFILLSCCESYSFCCCS